MTFEEYSGGGVTVMQLALSDARGRPFEDIMYDDVLQPIGMTRSSFEQPISPENDRNAARAHDGEGQSRGPKMARLPRAGGRGPVDDGRETWPGSPSRSRSRRSESRTESSARTTVQEMLSPVGVGGFAVGFGIAREGEGWYFSHGGGNWGFRCTLLAHKVKGYGLAIMTNADRGGAVMAEISRRIQQTYEWDSMAEPAPRGYDPIPERTEIDVPVDVLARYVGDYRFGEGTVVAVTLEDGQLHIRPSGQRKLPLFAESETTFFLKTVAVTIEFESDQSGEVNTMTIVQGGGTQTGTREPR